MLKLRVGVLSDIHIPAVEPVEKNLYNALSSFKKNKVDVIILAGDVLDQDKDWAFNIYNDIFNDVFNNERPLVLGVYGNHETMKNIHVIDANYKNDFLNYFKQEDINFHKIINGYHFIFVSSNPNVKPGYFFENSKERLIDMKGDYEYIKEWLDAEINKANMDNDGYPIFVVSHYSPKNTVIGTYYENSGNETLNEIFSKYPNVISLAGHTHCSLSMDRSIMQTNYTSINTGSLQCLGGTLSEYLDNNGKLDFIDFIRQPGDAYRNYTSYMIFDINDDNIVFKRYFALDKEIKCGDDWTIQYPIKKEDFVYTKERKFKQEDNYFDKNQKLRCYAIDGKDYNKSKTLVYCLIPIPKSIERVFGFKIVLSGVEEKEYYIFSEIDDNILNPKKYHLHQIENLTLGLYKIEVYAVDEYGNLSKNALGTTFEVIKNE